MNQTHGQSPRPGLTRTSRSAWARCTLGLAACSVLGLHTWGQRPPGQLDGAEILHRLKSLETVGSVLYVAAHPDDENTRLISWLVNGRHARTGYLSLTRGDGGQNLIGHDLGDALGVVRTQELLEARRIDGGEQFFTRAVDFGYSKTAEETFAKWGRQEVLGDVVRVIRTFRPDVILTRFDTDGTGGHGHHTASSILAREAFELAADPRAFPEQLAQGLRPWQTQRLYFNGSTWWRSDLAEIARKEAARWVTVDVGGFDPLLGASYTELAGRSRSQHKSQGFGAAETRGETLEYLRLDRGAPLVTADLFDGIDTSWSRLRGGERVTTQLRALVDAYDPAAPEASVSALSALVRALDEIGASDEPEHDRARHAADTARNLILAACGVVFEVTSETTRIAAGESARVSLTALQRSASPSIVFREFVPPRAGAVAVGRELAWNRPVVVDFAYAVDSDAPIDEPYWLTSPHEGLFQPDVSRYAGIEPASDSTSLFTGVFALADGLEIRARRALVNRRVDRVAGELLRPVVVSPVASVALGDPVVLVRGEQAVVTVVVEALRDDLSGEIAVTLPAGFSLASPPPPIGSLARGERRVIDLHVRRGSGAARGKVLAAFRGPAGHSDRTLRQIDPPHILPQTWYAPAECMLVPLEVAVDVRTVGYVDGAGDEIPEALRRLGVDVVRIDPALATSADLDACDTIVTGIRAYNTVSALARFQPLLLAYVERGGTLLVQYNTNGNDLVMSPQSIGPFPFTITRNRITVEEAEPTFPAPDHALLTSPNTIRRDDFVGWVQERGLYFAGEVDSRYTGLVTWSDPGEKPAEGALIAGEHGRGRFVYTGLSLFRQLPAGVPGAYRLLANLVQRRARRS